MTKEQATELIELVTRTRDAGFLEGEITPTVAHWQDRLKAKYRELKSHLDFMESARIARREVITEILAQVQWEYPSSVKPEPPEHPNG